MSATTRRKDETIQIRASAEAKAMLNRAAAARGQKLSEFVLESARQRAEETLLDQRLFLLDDAAFEAFAAMLDRPKELPEEVKRRLTRRSFPNA